MQLNFSIFPAGSNNNKRFLTIHCWHEVWMHSVCVGTRCLSSLVWGALFCPLRSFETQARFFIPMWFCSMGLSLMASVDSLLWFCKAYVHGEPSNLAEGLRVIRVLSLLALCSLFWWFTLLCSCFMRHLSLTSRALRLIETFSIILISYDSFNVIFQVVIL